MIDVLERFDKLASPWIVLNSTLATRSTGKSNAGNRRFFIDGEFPSLTELPPTCDWEIPAPWGQQAMVAFRSIEIITLPRHVSVRNIESYLNLSAIKDLRDPTTPPHLLLMKADVPRNNF
jgi:hypothetical protein